MTAAVLLSLLAAPPADSRAPVEIALAAWRAQEAETAAETGDLTWRVVRDSRTATFGKPRPEPGQKRLRFDRRRYRIDGVRRLFHSRDGRPLPGDDWSWSEAEFDAALASGFKAEGPFTEWRSVTVVLEGRRWPKGASELDRLLAAAPLLAIRPLSNPLLAIDPGRLTVASRSLSDADAELLVLEQHLEAGGAREFWVEPDHGFRPVRVVVSAIGGATAQLDLDYDDVDPHCPVRWTATRLDTQGWPLEFATAERKAMTSGVPLAAKVFQPPPESASAARPSGIAAGVFFDWPWLLTASGALLLIGILAGLCRSRLRPPGARPPGTPT